MINKMNNNNKNSIPQKIMPFKTNQIPINNNSFPQNIPQRFENISESPNQQEINPEILNISKIKDGFFIGDRLSGITFDVINEFKITHIINCTGEQIINQWESLGINYLTINWSENSNQILFDLKDEIANKIMEFIDRALLFGEGVLAHSFNGKNRVCIVAIIYLMKKYKWSLYKSMEYLKSKKDDVEITNYFYNQLENFQKRLILKGELTRDIPWEFENLIDNEEKLLRNTYMNGLPPNLILKENENNKIMDLLIGKNIINEQNKKMKHIIWADNNPYCFPQGKIEIFNLNNDLFLKKDIKPILFHLKSKFIKPCIKNNKNKKTEIQFNVNFNGKKNINIIKQKINFENVDKNNYRNEYINKLESNNNIQKKLINNNYNSIKNNKIYINNYDKNISDNNTNSNTPADEVKELFDNRSSDIVKNKFTFNIGSINSLNPSNVKNFQIFNEDFNKEPNKLYNKDNEFNNKKNQTNYSLIYNNDKKIKNTNKTNNNNISNYAIGFNKKNQNIDNLNHLNKPINNFNPNLIGNKNQPISEKENYLASHPFFNKNNNNKQKVPVKIKNYNNNYISIIKKPGTPILNHVNHSTNFTSKDNCKNTKNVSNRSNSSKKSSSFSNNFNPISTAISFNNNTNMKNNVYNHYNKSSSERPSTAPHKDKKKTINGINFNSNINQNNKKNLKTSVKSKINQRPNSVENKNKVKNNNLSKNYSSNNNNKNNVKIKNYYNNIYGTGNNNKEIFKNNVKSNNNHKYNISKQRRESPLVKTDNYLNKNIIK